MSAIALPTYYSWSGVEWAGRQDVPDALVDAMLEPDLDIIGAFESFRRRFYPDERAESVDLVTVDCQEQAKALLFLLKQAEHSDILATARQLTIVDPFHRARTPWIGHQAAKRFYTQLDALDRALFASLTDEQRNSLYRDALQSKLAEPWLLSWHWRAILPAFREYEPSSEKPTVVQVTQVRQWNVLLCYTVKGKTAPEELPGVELERKVLVRPPLFSVGHRLLRWDAYRLFYMECARGPIQSAMKELGASKGAEHGYSQPLAMAYILGRHDCYYLIDDIKEDAGGVRIEARSLVHIHPEYITPSGSEKGADGRPLVRPYDEIAIPWFGVKSCEPEKRKTKPILLASDNYCKAIDQLSEVFNDRTAQSVLIIAPPGSGKEALAEMAHRCGAREGHLISTTLAGLEVEEVRHLLFSRSQPLEFDDDGITLKEDATSYPGDGLVFRALRGSLFLDEIDKTSKAVRSLLLRFLESKELTLPRSVQTVRIPEHLVPLYIFAGSKSRRDMFELDPADFWTRVSHVIEMSHPVDLGDLTEVQRVAREYVRFLWRKHVVSFMDAAGFLESKKAKTQSEQMYQAFVAPFFKELRRLLLSTAVLDFVSEVLCDELVGHGRPLPSIRGIRSTVGRSVFKTFEMFLYAKDEEEEGIEVLKDHLWTNDSANWRNKRHAEWFEELARVIMRVRAPVSETAQLEKRELEFVQAFRQTLRQGTVAV